MDDIDFSITSIKTKYEVWVGVMIALAIVVLFNHITLDYLMNSSPKRAGNLLSVIIPVMVLFSAIAGYIYYKKRFKIKVTGRADNFTIEVLDPDRTEPIVIHTPFECSLQWTYQKATQRIKIKIVNITIIDQMDDEMITFKAVFKNSYKVPDGFEFIDLKNKESARQLRISNNEYSTGKKDVLVNLISGYVSYDRYFPDFERDH